MRFVKIDGHTSKCYKVSEEGVVYNIEGKVMKESLTHDGYVRVRLCRDLPRKMYRVHRIVAETYLDNSWRLPQVNHLDGNKKNNSKNNLEFCDNSYNMKHSHLVVGLNSYKQPVMQCTLDGTPLREFDSLKEAEVLTGIANQNISKVCRGLRKHAGNYKWKYVTRV